MDYYSLISNFLDGCGDYYIKEIKTACELRCTEFDCSHVNNLSLRMYQLGLLFTTFGISV